eukprot:3722064-Amphidinium_carterae.1
MMSSNAFLILSSASFVPLKRVCTPSSCRACRSRACCSRRASGMLYSSSQMSCSPRCRLV